MCIYIYDICIFQDCALAIELASQALQLKSKCFEAYYARARAKRDDRFVGAIAVIHFCRVHNLWKICAQ